MADVTPASCAMCANRMDSDNYVRTDASGDQQNRHKTDVHCSDDLSANDNNNDNNNGRRTRNIGATVDAVGVKIARSNLRGAVEECEIPTSRLLWTTKVWT